MEHVIQDILAVAGLIGAVTAIGVCIVRLVMFFRKPGEQDKAIKELRDKHEADMKAMQTELTVICYGLRGALQGLIEKGCNGPCKEALQMLDKHLNKSAHDV